MQEGENVMEHFLKFDGLCMIMQAIGDEILHHELLGILLGSLSNEYDHIIKIVENIQDIDLFRAKEMLRREYEGIALKEKSELALKAKRNFKSSSDWSKESRNKFSGKFFVCNKYGHKKQDCWKNLDKKKKNTEQEFTVGENGRMVGYSTVVRVVTCAHFGMSLWRFALCTSRLELFVANGESVTADGIGTIRVVLKNKKPIRIEDVLYVPKLDCRLISINALSTKGLHVTFSNKTCVIK